MDANELAIARAVIYASLFDYPLTLEQLHRTLIESRQSAEEILATYHGSDALHRIVDYRDGFFFPAGRDQVIAERQRREAQSRAFLVRHRLLLRLICAVPYTRMVALSGSIAHRNLEPGGDLDLFIVTRGRHVWTVTLAILALTKLLGRRRVVCANFVLADSHLALEQQDLFTANQVIHLEPLVGGCVLEQFFAANPFVTRFYPNATSASFADRRSWSKAAAEGLLRVPSPLIEAACRILYRWHLGRRAGSWRSPDQVRLDRDYLKLHTQSHRSSILARFDLAVQGALERADAVPEPVVAAAGTGCRAEAAHA
jgi:hypothetical protein